MFLAVSLGGCRAETVAVDRYEWVDPAVVPAPLPSFPGATPLRAQTDLLHRVYATLQPKDAPPRRVLLYETDAPIETVAEYYAKLYAAADGTPATVQRGEGDLAADEGAVAPLLVKLGHRFTAGVGRGAYRTAQITGGPGKATISLQRPWRDFVGDRVSDRTLIMVSE